MKRLVVFALLFSLFSCAQQLKVPESKSGEENVPSRAVSKAEREKYRAGITALYNNDLSKAQRIFNEFIRNKPKLAGGYANLALVHFKKKEFKKSLKQVNKALKLNPKQVQALNLRAQLYVLDGKIHKAKADYLLAVKTKPKYVNAQYNLALLYDVYLQEIELAIQHYKIYMSLLKKPDEITQDWITHLEGTLKNG
ncbi:MAG: tetratricopeptide repeat protein [Pseudomonadota bacterium]